jgi:gliding motility-associated-like protein
LRKLSVQIFFLSLFSLPFSSSAQLCQGSLGVPIVNKTFAAGPNPGAPLSSAATNYQFFTNDCPPDGSYTVRSNTSSCFGNSWHAISTDHTGDTNGYFMLVNASVQPGAFYVDTVRGLCAGTTFEFAAWIVNVLRPSACGSNGTKPNLTFTIEKTDGTLIQQYSTGDIAAQGGPVWQQYGFFFTTPVGITDVVLRIVNNAPGGCGNDLALDDITFRPCGPLLTSAITGYTKDTVTFCEGTARAFNFTGTISTGYANPAFQWQQSSNGSSFIDIAGATGTSLNVNFPASTIAGTYTYRIVSAEAGNMSNVGCRVISSLITIIAEALPVTAVTTNSPVCSNNTLQLMATSITAQYQWAGPNGFIATGNAVSIPNAQIIHSGKYYVLTSTAAGCTDYDSVAIAVNPVPVASINITSATICEDDTLRLVSSGGTAYQWLPAAGLSSATIAAPLAYPSSSVKYSAVVFNSFNCTDTAFADITVVKKARANAGPDVSTFAGVPVRLLGVVGGDNITYIWTPATYLDSPFAIQPLVTAPSGEYNYRLIVSSNVGCGFAPDDVKVIVYDKLYVPSAFTPNNDGKNDKWIIPAITAYPNAEVMLFNRHGEIIFREKGSYTGWDGIYKGTAQSSGTYVYLIKLNNDKAGDLLKGTVTLIR